MHRGLSLMAILTLSSIPFQSASATSHVHRPANRAAGTKAAKGQPPHLKYYGGRVLANVKVVAVFWGPSVDHETTSNIGPFYADFVTSPMFDWLGEYDTTVPTVDGRPGSGQRIRHGSFVKAVTITPRAQANPLLDKQIQQELQSQIKAGKVPKPDENTLYMFHFAPGQKIKAPGTGLSCKDFCAYHSSIGKNTYYAVIPDEGKGSGCDIGCGNANPFGNLTASAAHEIIEAVTDPEVGALPSSAKAGRPLAWYDPGKDSSGQEWAEIGDICSAYEVPLQGKNHVWTVQKMWSNKANGCIALAADKPQLVSVGTGSTNAKEQPKGKAKPIITKSPPARAKMD